LSFLQFSPQNLDATTGFDGVVDVTVSLAFFIPVLVTEATMTSTNATTTDMFVEALVKYYPSLSLIFRVSMEWFTALTKELVEEAPEAA
jgi:uncharacterized protein YqhQ